MMRPERLNLSIGCGCFVSCPGCYSFFGTHRPLLGRFERTVAQFVALGVDRVTISGGDPLLIDGLLPFVARLRDVGVRSVKVDTVGTSWVDPSLPPLVSLPDLLNSVDVLAIPLDGWSNESVAWFRRGRPALFDETCALLERLDHAPADCRLYVNTVATRLNCNRLTDVYGVLRAHTRVSHWNVFQYTPTDQARTDATNQFWITRAEFSAAQHRFEDAVPPGSTPFRVEFPSVMDRLGSYLLINSDGEVWLPNARGRTIRLGGVFGREYEVLEAWSKAVADLSEDADDRPGASSHPIEAWRS